jgi:hypothetical protein
MQRISLWIACEGYLSVADHIYLDMWLVERV